MIKWFKRLKKKYGIHRPVLCSFHKNINGDYCPACVAYTRGWGDARQVDPEPELPPEKFAKAQRYDEIERDRKRRKKG